jgi:hypothetical protein
MGPLFTGRVWMGVRLCTSRWGERAKKSRLRSSLPVLMYTCRTPPVAPSWISLRPRTRVPSSCPCCGISHTRPTGYLTIKLKSARRATPCFASPCASTTVDIAGASCATTALAVRSRSPSFSYSSRRGSAIRATTCYRFDGCCDITIKCERRYATSIVPAQCYGHILVHMATDRPSLGVPISLQSSMPLLGQKYLTWTAFQPIKCCPIRCCLE